jgi:hypothetical protein
VELKSVLSNIELRFSPMLSNVSAGLRKLKSVIGTAAHNPSDSSADKESLRNLAKSYFRTYPPEKVTLSSHADKLKLPSKLNNGDEALTAANSPGTEVLLLHWPKARTLVS